MQLIRLGDASNFSHGRTSASTLDDAFSGAADASSSTGPTSDGAEASDDEDDELPPRSRQKLESSPLLPPGATKKVYKPLDEILPSCDSSDPSCDDLEGDGDYAFDDGQDEAIKNEEPFYLEPAPKTKKAKQKPVNTAMIKGRVTKSSTSAKPTKSVPKKPSSTLNKAKTPSVNGNPNISSTVVESPAVPGKAAGSAVNFQHQLAADEEDLSTKPRCQRCRKSKKGCDRQRPCQRCKDAGIGIEGCISEDEGNGRKGRYGRHMGVPVKKAVETVATASAEPQQPAGFNPGSVAPSLTASEKSKKRKR